MNRVSAALTLSYLCSCAGIAGLTDAGPTDAGTNLEGDAGTDAGASAPDAGASDAGDAGSLDAGLDEPPLTVDAGTWSKLSWPEFWRVPAYFRDPAATDAADAGLTTVVPWREFSRPVSFDGGLYYFGGGHSGYSGNDLMRFDTVAQRWQQLYRPHVPPPDDSTYYSGGSERVYLDPHSSAWEPYVVHNYARSTYLPGRGYAVMLRCPSADELASRDSGLSEQPFGLAIYDEVANSWSCDARTDEQSIIVNTADFDPDLGGLLGFGSRYDTTAFSVYRPDAGWVALKTFNAVQLGPPGMSGQQAIYLPERHGHLIFRMPQGGSFAPSAAFFDSKTLTVTDVPLPPALVRDVGPEGSMSAAYDAARHEVVLFSKWGSRSRVWHSPLDRWAFELENDRGPDFTSTGAADRSAVLYDSRTNAFYFIQASGDDTTTLKWPAIAVWKYER